MTRMTQMGYSTSILRFLIALKSLLFISYITSWWLDDERLYPSFNIHFGVTDTAMTAAPYPATAIPELTENQIKSMFLNLDEQLNTVTLQALTHGIYTGVVAVTLWAVASREKPQNNRRPYFLVLTILVLYLLATVGLYGLWSITVLMFITNNKTFWMAFKSADGTPVLVWVIGITAILSTILADVTLIWRCWTVWGRSWRVVLIPILCTTSAAIGRGIVTYYDNIEDTPPQALYTLKIVNWAVLYASLILATLLWCTIFIIYRILRVGGVTAGMRVYHRVIEMLVESAALYTTVLVIILVLEVRNELAGGYVQAVAAAVRGIAPTLLAGRVAAGHARPDDSWNESTTASSLRFGNHSSSQNDGAGSGSDASSRLRPDLEEGSEGST
ncbi:hypothetical protein ARMSODRAFT_1078465 [Armillaria solidipes]|uniref:Uncharacterized protein n=1 Tax=Armillaria solidipes TaxID=1076256 RepID=A0A2H3BZL1_9AGAR|nr:hypothetical protein ARMSODRAFT_1078465 [Armillaria solidipes]